ncbi:acyl-CoA dehydrogenase domain-containing protein, partial [Methylicorpusculum sp.]
NRQLTKGAIEDVMLDAIDKHIISREEAELLHQAERARFKAISVDDFARNDLEHHSASR